MAELTKWSAYCVENDMGRRQYCERRAVDAHDHRQGIMFDCLDTLLLLEKMPSRAEEALWGFAGIEPMSPWKTHEAFLSDFFAARKALRQRYGASIAADFRYSRF